MDTMKHAAIDTGKAFSNHRNGLEINTLVTESLNRVSTDRM